ncbi:MAG TPA: L-threonylcarbamoyladenylate synthase [Acidobacteriaceae bacterium]|nr:L-threonylcarbamoyladenylate synthase [Acidobacteriaceae bacterium]
MTANKTVRLEISVESTSSATARTALSQAAEVIRSGGTVAFPTETVYGLGANALDPAAVEKIFLAKQRPAWDPMIVHIADRDMLAKVAARAPGNAQQKIDALMDQFWPGPLTILLPKQPAVPSIVTAGRDLVGVRMPAHPVALALINAANLPIAAPSANRFGHTSPTTALHVLEDLEGRIDLVLDSGPAWCGVESTVIEVRDHETILYRPGAIPAKEIKSIAGPVVLYRPSTTVATPPQLPESLPSPGVDMRHYAPNACVILLDMSEHTENDRQKQWLQAVQEQLNTARKIGVLLPADWPLPDGFRGIHFAWGSWEDDQELAQRLFAGLRTLDGMGAEVILCPLPGDSGLGAAIRDRLLKAARAQ